MKYFTSDWHLNEDRIGIFGKPDLFYRNGLFVRNDSDGRSVRRMNHAIFDNFVGSNFRDGDELWHLGDVIYQIEGKLPSVEYADSEYGLLQLRRKYPNSKFNLIVGNYDEDKLDLLGNYFDNIYQEGQVQINGSNYYLNHYPINCKPKLNEFASPHDFAITGHIHGLWKVQPNMVNVGVDAWHFRPVSETEIDFCMNACKKFYDQHVFPYAT